MWKTIDDGQSWEKISPDLTYADPETLGVTGGEIPSVTVESTPGDLIIWNFRTIHGSYNGGERRRLFSMNFGEAVAGTHDANLLPNKPIPVRSAICN